jgi:hypothetical protein
MTSFSAYALTNRYRFTNNSCRFLQSLAFHGKFVYPSTDTLTSLDQCVIMITSEQENQHVYGRNSVHARGGSKEAQHHAAHGNRVSTNGQNTGWVQGSWSVENRRARPHELYNRAEAQGFTKGLIGVIPKNDIEPPKLWRVAGGP